MSALIAVIILGVLQGLTEFLPVSSSGHLSLFQYFSKDIDENLTLNIAVHLGTFLTIIVYYRKDLWAIVQGLLKRDKESLNMFFLLVVASVPTATLGLIFKKKLPWILTNPVVAASCLVVTGVMLFFSDRINKGARETKGFGLSVRQALIIGTVQGLAVLPGISRSGSTIVTGLGLGMTPANASRFSFLVSLPAIFGASLLEIISLEENVQWTQLALGAVVSFLVGLLAIFWMVQLTLRGRLKSFSYYVFALAGAFFICYFMGWGQNAI